MLRRRKPPVAVAPADPTGLRRFIFGDCPIDEWPPGNDAADTHPWSTFVQARDAIARGDTAEAEARWRSIANGPGLESRSILQAWHFLRSIGVVAPDEIAKDVLGAVAEVAVPDGHDLLAVYADGSVRFLSFSGAAVVIDDDIASVRAPASDLLEAGRTIVGAIGPWEGPLPPLPAGHSRLTMLTPSGPHFGQGPDGPLRADPTAGPFFEAATRTLVAVVDLPRGDAS